MAFAEDMTAFFNVAEFASTATFSPTGGGAAVSAAVLMDMPTEDFLGGDTLSDEYSIVFAAGSLSGIRAGDYGTIDGVQYRIREIRLLSDGKIKRAKLSKV